VFLQQPTLWIGGDTAVPTVTTGVITAPNQTPTLSPQPMIPPPGYQSTPGATISEGFGLNPLPSPSGQLVNPPTVITQTPGGTVISPVVPQALPPNPPNAYPAQPAGGKPAAGGLDPITVGIVVILAIVAYRMLR
jgi:hypothetical protein